MPVQAELPPITDERRQAVAQWVEANVRPVLHMVAEGTQPDGSPQQEFELRDYQIDGWAKLEAAREVGRTRALGNLATGLGKTFEAAVDVMRYREWWAAQDPTTTPRILYVSHQKDINEQAANTFRALMPEAKIGFLKSGQQGLPDADMTFATLQGLYSKRDRIDPQAFEYIIWDESHHLEAETYKQVRDHFDPLFEHAITATIQRMDQKDIQEYFGEPLYQKTLPEGIAEGHLVDVDYHIVFDDIVKQLMEEGFEPKTLKEFHDIFKIRPRNEVIAKNIREEQHKIDLDEVKTIVFCESVAHAEEMAEILGGVAYHSEVKKNERKHILADFRAGNRTTICTVDMFNEGIDIPDARLLVFLRSTQSGAIFEQQLGRGLRKAPGKEKVSVLDFVANIERIAKVRELANKIRRVNPGHGTGEGIGKGNDIDSLPINDLPSDGGLEIHSQHSEFDFNIITVNLLKKWSQLREKVNADDKQLIALALKLKPDGPLTTSELNDLSKKGQFLHSSSITSRFGSIANFQRACGFDVRDLASLSNQEIIELAKTIKPDRALTGNEMNELSQKDMFIGATTIVSRFGSVRNFSAACGFKPAKEWATKEDIINAAHALKATGTMTYAEIGAYSKKGLLPNQSLIANRFGSVRAFLEESGYTTRQWTTPEAIVERAKELKPDRGLTMPEIDKLSRAGDFVSPSTIIHHFGTMNAFHEACGIKELKTLSDEELVGKVRELKPDGPLTYKDVQSLSKTGEFVSYRAILRRFGSLKALNERAGW